MMPLAAETSDVSDADLVTQSLAGNRDAFGRIVSRYQSLLCSLAYSATGNLTLSEDLTQESFITAWKQLANLREPAKLRSWLCSISRNVTYDLLRQQGREPSHQAESLETVQESPASELLPLAQTISNEEQAILWRSIEGIPQIYREPLVLFYRENQSIEAVAQLLDLSKDTVKQRLSRGRKLLHEQVLCFVEGALQKTKPGGAFTCGVLAALPPFGLSSQAATLGVAAKGTSAAKAGATGVLLFLLGPLLVLCGSYASYRTGLEQALSEEERRPIKSLYRKISLYALGFFILFAGLACWICRNQPGPWLLTNLLTNGLVLIYLAALCFFAIASRRVRQANYFRRAPWASAAAFPAPAWEYRSSRTLLGLPLVHICIGDRFSSLKKPVRAWIAVGHSAVGGLFAFGTIALAPLSIGLCAVGLLPFGAFAVGLLALGGAVIGGWTFGAIAVGWQAFGCCAIGWEVAAGGLALGHQFAVGSIAQAAQANNDAAWQYIRPNLLFQGAQILFRYCAWLNLIWVIPLLAKWRIVARKRLNQGRRSP